VYGGAFEQPVTRPRTPDETTQTEKAVVRTINLLTHSNFTIDELIQLTGWPVPSAAYRENLRRALAYFQQVVPKSVLRRPDDAGPWNLRINGTKIKLLNWLQGIDFRELVNPQRVVNKGDPLVSFKDPSVRPGKEWGRWYTFPSTQQESVAVHSTQTRPHKFQARMAFTCMQSTASDAYVGWLTNLPPEYRHGGAQQLFIWNPTRVLELA
jgi:hypothetical protein